MPGLILLVWGNTLSGFQVQLLKSGKTSQEFIGNGDIVPQSLKFDLYSKGPGDDADLYEIGSLSGRYDQMTGIFESTLTLEGKKSEFQCMLP